VEMIFFMWPIVTANLTGTTKGETARKCFDDVINAAVMLSEAKHLWLFLLRIGPKLIRDSSLRSE